MARLLIVEDDKNLGLSLKDRLESEGYQVEWAETLQAAGRLVQSPPDLIILDWMLPDGQGQDFLVNLRKQSNKVPVIFLTARVELVDKILGLELGANDYMTKPFEPRELLARVRVQLRDQGAHQKLSESNLIRVGALSIDTIKHKVVLGGVDVDLVKKEFELLVLLAESPEKVFSRDEILNKVWGYDVYPTTRTVDTHIMMLRQKLRDELIETVRSVGYRLKVIE
ncbi:response regulator transcription factor [Bdellovibrio sp. HCB337]|uniref:response regulator transcription factor n=1 Tax=Bdellovibrio sp. HCB337 TaxID=3394358 RepID=UPI0039A659A1